MSAVPADVHANQTTHMHIAEVTSHYLSAPLTSGRRLVSSAGNYRSNQFSHTSFLSKWIFCTDCPFKCRWMFIAYFSFFSVPERHVEQATRNALPSNRMRSQADPNVHTLLEGNKLSNGKKILLNKNSFITSSLLLINSRITNTGVL